MGNPVSEKNQAFNTYADSYDAWYDSPKGKLLLSTELACLRPLVEAFPRPRLEVGVGSGRFDSALGVGYGLDPSPMALQKASQREITVVRGRGEDIPFKAGSFGGVLVAFTICFVAEPDRVFREIQRVLVPGGGVVLGVLLKGLRGQTMTPG